MLTESGRAIIYCAPEEAGGRSTRDKNISTLSMEKRKPIS